jgi:hypothetical protein
MAAKYIVDTPDLKIQFWDRSFRVNNLPFIYTQREMTDDERMTIGKVMQAVYDAGKWNLKQPEIRRGFRYHINPSPDMNNLVAWIKLLEDQVRELGGDPRG